MVRIDLAEILAWVQKIATRSVSFLAAMSVLLLITGAAAAAEAPQHINVDADGYSIDRYDPVAYFTAGRPVRGKAELHADYRGAKYSFSSTSNRDLFLANPDKYVPQYGGFCAYGAAHGGKSEVDPEVWEIVDGKLYLMISGGTMSVWQTKKNTYIQMADKAWHTITE